MNVLIICNDFPPLNTIGSDRPYSWYKYFHRHSINTTVITKNWIDSGLSNYGISNNIATTREVKTTESGIIIKVPHNTILPELISRHFGLNKFTLIRKAVYLHLQNLIISLVFF